MLLQYLIEDLENIKVVGDTTKEIKKIQYNSRKIENLDIYICLEDFKRYSENKFNYIEEAIKNGACAIIVGSDYETEEYEKQNITVIKVESVRKTLAIISSKYYDFPSRKLTLIGVTGTKGKTTTSYMIREILNASGKKTSIIGTMYNLYNNKQSDVVKTYKESLDLHELLNDMLESEVKYVVIEVGSNDIDLFRLYGLKFATSVFTNLSENSQNKYETMEAYLSVKSKLFNISDYSFINGDDIYTPRLLKCIDCNFATYGLDNAVDLTAADIRISVSGVEFKMYVNKMLETIKINIPGRFVVYNALAAIGVASLFNCQMDSIILALQNVRVPGRSEVLDVNKIFTVMLDYSNSVSSIESTLLSIKKYAKGRIICVFGCIKATTKEERITIGEIFGRYSDFIVITTDNKKVDNESRLCQEIETGVKNKKGLYKVIENREKAIKFAMRIAWKNDIILVVGKPNGNHKIISNQTKIEFDERNLIKELAKNMEEKNITT